MTSLALAFSSNNTAGNLLVYVSAVDASNTGTLTAATDNNGNTIVNAALNDTTTGAVRVDFVKVSNSGANTVTANTNAANRMHLHIWEVSGLTSNPLDQTNTGSQTATSQSISTSGATTVASELVMGVFYDFSNNDSLTAGSGFSPSEFTDGGSTNESMLSEVETVSSTGTQTATATCGSAGSTVRQIIATFKGSGVTAVIYEDDSFNPSLNAVLVQQAEPTISVW